MDLIWIFPISQTHQAVTIHGILHGRCIWKIQVGKVHLPPLTDLGEKFSNHSNSEPDQ